MTRFSPLNLSAISVRRKIAMVSFIIMLVLLGLSSYRHIGIDILPKFDVPYVQITAVYPGASPEEVESEVARRIEDAVGSLDGLKHITSICMENAAAITLEFELGTDVNLTLHDVREKLNRIADDFPDTVETPVLSKLNVNTVPVATLFLTGKRSIDDLHDFAKDKLADAFSSLPGVGEVRLHGGSEVQLHIIPDRKKLAECGITLAELVERVRKNHLKLPIGHLKRENTEITLTFDAEFHTVSELKELEIGRYHGKRVHLGDLAEIRMQSKEIRQLASLDGKPGVLLDVVKKADVNSVKVIQLVRKRFQEYQQPGRLPSGMKLEYFKDSGEFIQAAVDDAWGSVFAGMMLTALVLYLFLHHLRPTLIIIVTLPVSFVISFLMVRSFGYTFDMMTLAALGCACGVLVDNSVVVLESIFSRLSRGDSPALAAVSGTSSVANAVLASSLTNIVVFVPIALMTSVAGLIVCPFAGVMVLVTLISIFITFTLTPILASLMLNNETCADNRLARWWDKGYQAVLEGFLRSLEKVKSRPLPVIGLIAAVSAAILCCTVPHLNFSFVPSCDRGEMTVNVEFPAASSLEANQHRTARLVQKLAALPFVEHVASTSGYRNATTGQLAEGVYLAGITLKLVPVSKRKAVDKLLPEVRRLLEKEENLLFNLAVPVISGTSGAELTCYIKGPDQQVIDHFVRAGAEQLRRSGVGVDVDTTVRPGKPRIILSPNRPVLRNLGMDASTAGVEALANFDGIEAGTWKIGGRSFDIRIKTNEERGVESIAGLIVGSKDGKPLNLETAIDLRAEPVMLNVQREDKERCGWIYANPARGKSLSNLVDQLNMKIKTQLPTGYTIGYFGQADMMGDGIRDFLFAFTAAVVLIYLLIAAIMESWTKPFLILFTVPLGFVGFILLQTLTGTSFSIVGMLGAIMMIGIVVNNAILILDEVGTLTSGGMAPAPAMIEACRNKFRAIMMTSLTSIIGILPMALGQGLGSEIRSACGIGVVGGLTYSTALTLYLIPALYFVFCCRKKPEER